MAQTDLHFDAQNTSPLVQRHHFYHHFGKRGFDILLAAFLLPFAVPLIALLWFLNRCTTGSGLFHHTRLGRGGTPFKCWKIRTMVPDADARLAAVLASDPDAARQWARCQKLHNDPRVTRLGRFLRRSSLDELPQIWNVLRGDMSFVGPRPITAQELARYGINSHYYLRQRPGITGLWQVTARTDGAYDTRRDLDVRYAKTSCFTGDICLLLRTVATVLKATGS